MTKHWRPSFPASDFTLVESNELTPHEELAWRRLRDFMWLEPSLSLPLNDDYLRRRSRLTSRQWASARARVLALFEIVEIPAPGGPVENCGQRECRVQDPSILAAHTRQLNSVQHAEFMNEVRWKSLRDNKCAATLGRHIEVEVEKDTERSSITSNRARANRAGQNNPFASEQGKNQHPRRRVPDAITPKRTAGPADTRDFPPPEAEDPRPPDHPARVACENLGTIEAVVRGLETRFAMPGTAGRRR
jgi:hypothetical protein